MISPEAVWLWALSSALITKLYYHSTVLVMCKNKPPFSLSRSNLVLPLHTTGSILTDAPH